MWIKKPSLSKLTFLFLLDSVLNMCTPILNMLFYQLVFANLEKKMECTKRLNLSVTKIDIHCTQWNCTIHIKWRSRLRKTHRIECSSAPFSVKYFLSNIFNTFICKLNSNQWSIVLINVQATATYLSYPCTRHEVVKLHKRSVILEENAYTTYNYITHSFTIFTFHYSPYYLQSL